MVLLPAYCAASQNPPALAQYMNQLQCSTKTAFDKVDTVDVNETVLIKAAEECVPLDYKAELTGLSDNVKPSTRQERVEGLVRSVKTRASLCRQQNLSAPACIKMFVPSQD